MTGSASPTGGAAGESTPREFTEKLKVQGEQLAEKVKELVHEGNVRHLVIKHEEQTILEIPVTLGLVGAVLAPALAAVAAVGALLADCTVDVVRTEDPAADSDTIPSPPVI